MKTLLLTLLIAFPTLSGFGQTPDNYSKARQINDLSAKKRFVLGLEKAEQVKLWKRHHAYISATEDLTDEQEEFLTRSIRALVADEMTEELEQEANELFDKELGDRVFNPGPYTQGCVTIIPKASVFGFGPKRIDCNCRQTGTNWGCGGYCTVSSCTGTPDGCSIFYMYPCDGTCGGNNKAGN